MELHPDGLLRGKSSCPLTLVPLTNHQSLNPYFGSWLFVAFLSSLIPFCPSPRPPPPQHTHQKKESTPWLNDAHFQFGSRRTEVQVDFFHFCLPPPNTGPRPTVVP